MGTANRDTVCLETTTQFLFPSQSPSSAFPRLKVPHRLHPPHLPQAHPEAIKEHSRWEGWEYFHPHSSAEHAAPRKSRATKDFGRRGLFKTQIPLRANTSGSAGTHSTCLGGPGTLRAKLWHLENINNSKPVCDSRCPTHPPKVTWT